MPGGHFVTHDMLENARKNLDRYDWARTQREETLERAQRWIDLRDDVLWNLVTDQSIGRSTNASVEKGCPRCGTAHYKEGGSFRVDVLTDPWKILCTNCDSRFPTNDYESFYKSGLGEDSFFHPETADRSLLFNTDHPDPGDPEHLFGVDDGTGWVDASGESFKLVGVYGHHGIWGEISRACGTLREAFLLTGDNVYAHKAGVLLARVADVYPAMDWSRWAKLGFFNSDGLSGRGRIYGRIWEPGLLTTFTTCYDAVRDAWANDPALFQFLERKQCAHDLPEQDTAESLCEHFENHVIREGIDAIVKGDVCRNEPGDQVTMATLAVALDSENTDDWLDWVFREGYLRGRTPNGGHIPQLFADKIDRDGVGSEGAPSYSLGWLHKAQGMNDLDRTISARAAYVRYRISDYDRFRQMFLGHIRMICLGRYIPSIGDTGSTGRPNLCGLTVDQCLEGFERFGDPIFAQVAYFLAEEDPDRLRRSIFDPDPDSLRKRVEEVIQSNGRWKPETDLMTGYGLAMLRDTDEDFERTLWLYYGRNIGHGHADRLNLGLYAFGLDLLPDLGYPEHARVWPKRLGWTNHTVSHNTVLVDRSLQSGSYSGRVDFSVITPQVQAIKVRSPDVYPQCSRYERASALIRISEEDFYVVDLFGVSGGTAHHWMFHAAEGEVETEGMDLLPQKTGTYAGPDIDFGKFYDGEVTEYRGSGFQYLYDVRRCPNPSGRAVVDWTIKDTWGLRGGGASDVHLRATLLDPPGEVALCHGDPPGNKPGNPRRLVYMVAAHESQEGVDSDFLTVIEPYRNTRVVLDVQKLSPSVDRPGIGAVRVRLPGDRSDVILFGDGQTSFEVEGNISFDGRFGVYSETTEGSAWGLLAGGTVLGSGNRTIRRDQPVWSGVVSERAGGRISTDALLLDGLTGSYITVANDNERDAFYRIEEVRRENGMTVLDVGDVDFIRGMVDELDYSKGFLYDFEPGQTFEVTLHTFKRWEP